MDSFATAVSLALQYGVPLDVLCSKFTHVRFEPSGWSGNPKIGYAKSIVDYVFRWLERKFITGDQGELFKAVFRCPFSQLGMPIAVIRLEHWESSSRWEIRPPATSAVRLWCGAAPATAV